MRPLVAGLLVVLALAVAGSAPAAAEAPGPALRVLFVGNSLTETNDLPRVVAALADAAGRRLDPGAVVFGGFSLEDHWNAGVARAALADGDWDAVVMQQGPSSLPSSQANLREWALRFADAARAAGARPALLTVWPESARLYALPQVIGSYRDAAAAARATLLPGGAAWQQAWRCDGRLPLYGADGFHPGPLGTYAAALVVYGRLFAAPLVGLPSDLRRYGAELAVAPRSARLVKWAAARALGRTPATARCGR